MNALTVSDVREKANELADETNFKVYDDIVSDLDEFLSGTEDVNIALENALETVNTGRQLRPDSSALHDLQAKLLVLLKQ